MVSCDITVTNSVGLYARPATMFVQEAGKYKCSINLECGEMRINAKSLLGVLSICLTKGKTAKLICDGVDEKEALMALSYMVSNNFSE